MTSKFCFFIVVILFLPKDNFAQDSLSLLTWNVQMLPNLVNSNGKAKRARAIVDQLKKNPYDVVVFQELFKRRSRRIITKGLAQDFPYHTKVLNQKAISFLTNGGVMIFSRFPIREVHEIRYTKRTGYDKLSRKGALLAELDFQGKPIQVIGTHLQAFGAVDIMYSQYHELFDNLLKPHAKEGVPQLICGDFNTVPTLPRAIPIEINMKIVEQLPRYQYMLKTLDASNGELSGIQQFTMDRPYNDLCKGGKTFRLLLDYVFTRTPKDYSLEISRQVKIMRQRWHRKHQDLSDHYGVEAVISGF